ncbi:Zinc transporter ZIP13-like 2, partial [Homarus americanus]
MQNSSPEWLESAMGSSVVVWPPWPTEWLQGNHMDTLTVLATEYQPWICSIIAALAVGLAGIVPLLLIPTDHEMKTNS